MKTFWIVSYDIADPKRLRKVAKFLEGYGHRIQYSVFQVRANDRDIERMKWELSKRIEEEDSIFYFRLCSHCVTKAQSQNPKLLMPDETITYQIL